MCWSRADGHVYFTSEHVANSQDSDIFRLNVETGKITQITDNWGMRPFYLAPAVSPDGGRLLAVFEPGPERSSRHLVLLDPDGKNLRPVRGAPGFLPTNPRWFPDGQRVLYSAGQPGRQHLYWARIDGTGSAQLTAGDWEDVEPDIWGYSLRR